MASEEVAELIKEGVRLLRLIALPQIRQLRENFTTSMLSSAKRRRMWACMDGTMTLADIGRKVGTTAEAVRQFVAEVEDKWPDVIEVRKAGGATYPRRLI